MQPVTPPRASRARHTNDNKQLAKGLQTPKTPFGKKLTTNSKNLLSPPPTISTSLLTPRLTPHHRKKRELSDAFDIFPSTTNNQRTLFPPTPSTIGSGRSKTNQFSLYNQSHEDLSPTKKSHGVNQSFVQTSPTTNTAPGKRKLIFDSIDEELDTSSIKEPTTPTGKVITESLIHEWNDEKFDSDDETGEVFITRQKQSNPFITNDSSHASKGSIINRNLPKQTEITLINKKGEKITRQLTQEEQNYKPKNLFKDLQKINQKIPVYKDNDN